MGSVSLGNGFLVMYRREQGSHCSVQVPFLAHLCEGASQRIQTLSSPAFLWDKGLSKKP